MSFKDIKGHQKAVESLKVAIKAGRFGHAYLFVGPESVGKNLVAKTLAKTLNCETNQTDSCDICSSCIKIDKNIHPDVTWIVPEGKGNTIKIEKIRQLRNNINLKPYEGRKKVYIIDKAHLMTDAAANSLLKTLEEPPPDSVLILISEKPERLFYTIKSRCQIIRFKPMSATCLEGILKKEHNLSTDFSHFLAYFSSGRLGKALRLKDEDALKWKNEVIDLFTPINNNRVTAQAQSSIIFDDDRVFFNGDKEKILLALNVLSVWYRDILILKKAQTENIVINSDRIDLVYSKLSECSEEGLLNMLEEVRKTISLIRQNVNPKLAINSLISQMGVLYA